MSKDKVKNMSAIKVLTIANFKTFLNDINNASKNDPYGAMGIWKDCFLKNDLSYFIELSRQYNSLDQMLRNSMNAYSMLSMLNGMALSDDDILYNIGWLMHQGFDIINQSLKNPDAIFDEIKNMNLMDIDTESYWDAKSSFFKELEENLDENSDLDIMSLVVEEPKTPFIHNEDVTEVDWEQVKNFAKQNMPKIYQKFASSYED